MTTTLITGANKGLGRETTRRLLADGHDVWLAARDEARGRVVAQELGARFVQLDVTDEDSIAAAAAQVAAESGRLDVLINNAGITGGHVPPAAALLAIGERHSIGAVVHLAAAAIGAGGIVDELRTGVDGLLNVLEAAAAWGALRVVVDELDRRLRRPPRSGSARAQPLAVHRRADAGPCRRPRGCGPATSSSPAAYPLSSSPAGASLARRTAIWLGCRAERSARSLRITASRTACPPR